jgi:Fe-S-cluster containining protein
MSRKSIFPNEIESKFSEVLVTLDQDQYGEAERLILELIGQAREAAERYFPFLLYGEILMKTGRWDESRDAFTEAARIAWQSKNQLWLVHSHEKIGDLSAAEENWFGALHQYRYCLRKGGALLDRSVTNRLEAKANEARSTLHSTVLSQDANILPLGREYTSGNLAISFVQRDIFLKTYFARCLECSFCHDWCCSFGADIDIENVEKIREQKDEIRPFIRESGGEWFEGENTYYEEYAGNHYARIKPLGPRCVFISKDQRGCGLHRYAISQQMDYHAIKPIVCILFPLSFEEGLLFPAAELDDNSLVCSGSGASVYRAMRDELEYYFGRELVEELDEIEIKVMSFM